MDATTVATRLRRSCPTHDAYTVRVANRRVAALVTAHPADARRWIHTTRWIHSGHIRTGRLIVGLGVQWTPTRRPLHGLPPRPATLQLCAGHRCLVFQLAQADAVPEALARFLADSRVTFVGSGSLSDRRMLQAHYGLHVASGRELRAVAGMGNASMEHMADRFLGYPRIKKPMNVSMSDWHALDLFPEQVEYACVDAYLAFRLGVHLCPGGHEPAPAPAQRAPVLPRAPPAAQRAPALLHAQAPAPAQRAPALPRAPPPARPPVLIRAAPPAARAPHPQRATALVAVAIDEAASSSKIAHTRPGITGPDTETEHHDVEVGGAGNISVAHSSDASSEDDGFSSDGLFSSDGFELVGDGAFTDEEEGEIGIEEYLARAGILSNDDYIVGMEDLNVDDDSDEDDDDKEEESSKEYTGIEILTVNNHKEEGYKEYTGIGILTIGNAEEACDEEFVGNGAATVVVEEGGQLDGYQAPEYFGESEAFYGREDGYAQDGGYDQEDYGYDQDEDGYDEFY